MKKELDVLFIAPSNASGIYQDLAKDYAGIEPPTWACLLAESCRSVGYKVDILDTGAENLSYEQSLDRIKQIDARFICFTVYGQNVNAGTTMMSGAVGLTNFLRENQIKTPIGFIGSHVQALPIKTLEDEKNIDIVFTNEGVYALRNLLSYENFMENLKDIKGIGYRLNNEVILNFPERLVPNNQMDIDLPGYAWDLLPKDKYLLDKYRAHFWHTNWCSRLHGSAKWLI